ncbi:MAG: DUF2283 domain-containing protein [Nanoarchaeota archaeon]
MERNLNKSGEYDYDLKNDILFFKVKDREYAYSIELGNLIVDFDEEDFVVGLQIFDASTTFSIEKKNLREIKGFQFKSKILNGLLTLNLGFSSITRNATTKHQPIIYERIRENIPNSELICTVN